MITYITIGLVITIMHIIFDMITNQLPVPEIADIVVAMGVIFGYGILVVTWPWQITSFIYGFIEEVMKGS